MAPLLEKYFEICREHPTLLVLMQVGGFYEAYGDDQGNGSAKKLSQILNIHLTKKSSKLPLSADNPYMCGIPTHAIQKHLTKLNDDGYEVMIYDQDADDPKKRFHRGTYTENMRMQFDDEEGVVEHRMFSLLVERYPVRDRRVTTYRYLVAMAYLEMNTGRVLLQEYDHEEVERAIDEFVLTYQPEEVVLTLHNMAEGQEEILWKTIEKSCRVYADKDPWKPCEQIHFFRKAFSIPEHENDAIVHLGLHRHPMLVECLGRLLRVLRKHDPLLMDKLQVPEFMPCDHRMRFNQDALVELNILSICEKRRFSVDKKKQQSLLDILSQGMNIMGKRWLEKMLRSPLCDTTTLQSRYQLLQKTMAKESTVQLPELDAEWYFLRWKRGKLSVRLLGQLLTTYQEMLGTVVQYPEFFSQIPRVTEAMKAISEEWNMETMDTGGLEFIRQLPSDRNYTEELHVVWEDMILFLKRYQPQGKLEVEDGRRYVIQLRPKQWKDAEAKGGFFEVHKTKSYVHISHPDLEALSCRYTQLQNEKKTLQEEYYKKTSTEFLEKYGACWETFHRELAQFSCFYTLSLFFKKHGYTQPEVEPTKNSRSFVSCTEFRHAIMERIHPDSLFVPYSCHLGRTEDPLGMLIYGINSSGKSTMLKSMGLCLWMAQCGLYVPAAKMRFAPFDALYSKIGIQDNLFLGHSTFVAEMNELLYILQRATKNSLVMCDELTSGTETKSATGIVVSTLLHFLEKQLCFFFTTHLHTVSKIPEVATHKHLKICHFRMDTQTKDILVKNIRLRYDRSLHEGSGGDLYGIEIAKAVGLPPSFIQQAFSYRERVSVHVRDAEEKIKVSRYNKRFVLTECFLCSAKDRLHTHHITPQSEFTASKNTIHAKDGLYNLMALCESCHETLHHPSPPPCTNNSYT
jgi:DNA mismatch repair protein MutS